MFYVQLVVISMIFNLYFIIVSNIVHGNGDDWYNYRDISDPQLWSYHPGWELCTNGQQQSPINIRVDQLKYDPNLTYFHMDKHKVGGKLENIGKTLVFQVNQNTRQHVTIHGGPLKYKYRIEKFYMHYGNVETRNASQHEIDGFKFPAEIQIYGYNMDLYENISEAQNQTDGLVAIAYMIELSENPNQEFYHFLSHTKRLSHKHKSIRIRYLDLHKLLPTTNKYITYVGSTTYPGCWQDTTWIVFNKPIYVTRKEFYNLRQLSANGSTNSLTRVVQPLNNRTLRTNIPECKTGNITKYYCFRCKHELNPFDRWGIKDYILYSICD